jgi:hypothetical protein
MDTPGLSSDPVAEVTRLTNRAAALAFASAFAIVVALVALPSAVRGGDPARRVAASAALVMAFGVTTWAWRARAQLRAARTRTASSAGPAETHAERVQAPPGRGEPPTGVARTRRSNPGNRSRPRPA